MDGLYTSDQHPGQLHAFSGIEGLRVTIGHVDADAEDFGMSRRELTLFLHGMLRLAGVPVVPDSSEDSPTLHMTLSVRKVIDLYTVSLSVELLDRVWLTRQSNGQALRATTWRRSANLVSNRHELRENTRMELGNLLSDFLNDFIAANRSNGRASA